jgi:hypothetical protein
MHAQLLEFAFGKWLFVVGNFEKLATMQFVPLVLYVFSA